MSKESVQEAATVDEAIQAALEDLDATEDQVEYEILTEPEKKMFGKSRDAQVRVWLVEEEILETDETADQEAIDLDSETVEEPEADIDTTDEDEDISAEDASGTDEQEEDSVICDEEKQPFSKENEALSDEELDKVADTAIEVLRSILAYFGAEGATIDEYEGDEGEILLDVIGEDLAVLIGRHGKTLDALQYAVTSTTNKRLGFRYPVIVDIEGYKYRRRQKIEGLAKSAASRVVKQGKSVKLRPMTPYERRIVHIALRDDRRVVTSSEGEEPNRRVVVKPRDE